MSTERDDARQIDTTACPGSLGTLLSEDPWRIGTVLSSPDPVLAERVSAVLDFVWIDLEHSALSARDAQTLAIAARSGGAPALTRVPRFDSDQLSAILDAGADGIVAPKVDTAEQARSLVAALSYPPQGTRGFAPRRASGAQAATSAVTGGRSVACIVQIETRTALENVDEIAAVPGVDILIIGTADLSLDLGDPLNMGSTELATSVLAVGAAAARHGKLWGVAIGSVPEWVERIRSAGASMLVFSSDMRLYGEAVDTCARTLRALS